ncbi:MAG: addiction module protein [Magnetococcales bacterium]|nr:addiction module protein [Magnetococcales bacterium]
MDASAMALEAQACKLSPLARLKLVDALLNSLDESDRETDRLWSIEAEGRLAAFQRGEMQAIPLDDVLARYR